MKIKAFFSGLFSRRSSKEAPSEDAQPVAEKVSPFADLKPEVSASSSSTSQPAKAKDVFLLDRLSTKARDTVGLYYPNLGTILIRNPYAGKAGRLVRCSKSLECQPLSGDWDGDGVETFGLYESASGFFWLWSSHEGEKPERAFMLGAPNAGWMPIVGDWTGSGRHGIGVYDPSSAIFWLRNEANGGDADMLLQFGAANLGWIPLAGDWNGDGIDGIGAYEPETNLFFLRNTLSTGGHELLMQSGEALPNSVPLVGDWNGDGKDGVGIFIPDKQQFILYDDLSDNENHSIFEFGPRGVEGRPFAVRWTF